MSSKDLYEQSSSTIENYTDRETQTSQIYDSKTTSNTTTPTRPLPQNIENKSKDGNVKVFEFCEIIQDPCDPDSVSLIKESFSEEVVTETPKGSISEIPTAKKYKYCREVTQPILKTFSNECPSIVPPRDKCINKPVCESEKPDYPPNYEVYSDKKSIQDKINSKSSVSAMNSDEKCKMHCKTTFINPEDSKPKECPSKTDPKKPCTNIPSATKCPPIPRCPSKENKSCESPKSPKCQKCDEVDEKKLKCCISSCLKDSIKAVKKGSATCINEIEKLIGVKHGEKCEDKPSYYLLEKPRCPSYTGQPDSSTSCPQKSSIQKFFDSQTQTVATIQCALKDFVGTVCTKTKEAVDVLKTESCKHLNIKSESATTKGKDVKEISSKNLSISEKIKAQMNKIDMSTGCESLEKLAEPAKVVLDKVASIVLSTVSITKDANFKKIADNILDAKFNKSSELDQTVLSQRPPRHIAQDHEPSTNSNMFTTIKTKLFSIFGQQENQDDDDDDDDLSAEKFFDKYCDQSISFVYSDKKSIQDKINSKSSVSAMNSDEKCKMHCKTTFINPEDSKPKECPSKTDPKKPCTNIPSATKCPPIPRCPSKENKSCESPKSPKCQKCDEVDEKKIKCCISSCLKDSIKAVKKGSATCINEIEKLIGVKRGEKCEDKPSYYLLEKPRCPSYTGQPDSSTSCPQKSSIQKFFDSQTQTVATIQCALKDFVGTVCTKTKEAVDVLKTESCKHLNIKSESATTKGKDVKEISSKNLSISEKIKAQMNKIDMSTGCESLEKLAEPAKVVLDKVASIVLSTVSITKDANFKKIADNILDAKFNKSSELDQTVLSQRPPRHIAQDHEPSTNSNMFTTIKTKLFSIFGQQENQDDDDDDDDLSAEKFFDKYCDQ